jgi:hypothetical protein
MRSLSKPPGPLDDLDHLTASALGERLVETRRSIDRMESDFSRCLARFANLQGYAEDGAVTLVQWLRWKCRLTPGHAFERAQVARLLPTLPLAEAALANGEIGYDHAAVLARSSDEVGAEAAAKAEPDLVDWARKLDPARLRLVARHLRHCVNPDGVLKEANQAYDRRALHLSQMLDGVFRIDGILDPEGGATLQTALNALMAPELAGESRRPAERRADALVELAHQRLATGELPDVGGLRPHLTVTAPLATLRREPESPAGELQWSDPIPAESVRRLACDASIIRVLLDPASQPIDVGRATRVISSALRVALVVRDFGCRFPGCDRPPAWTEGHHLVHWADGGETNLDNVVLMCRRHHRRIHEGGWTLAWSEDRTLVAIQPEWTRLRVDHSHRHVEARARSA